MKNTKKEHLIWSSDIHEQLGTTEEIKEQFKEHLEINDYTSEKIEDAMNGDKYLDYAYETVDIYLDDEQANVPNDNEFYVIVAQIGRWNGTFAGGKIVRGLWDAINKCKEGEDYAKIFISGKRLTVKTANHDGSSYFEIRKLTDRGVEYMERHDYEMSDRELHTKLFGDSHYSHDITVFKEVYGW